MVLVQLGANGIITRIQYDVEVLCDTCRVIHTTHHNTQGKPLNQMVFFAK